MFEFVDDWTRLTERIGYWVDLEHPYWTLDDAYVESVWWALGELWERGLLYEGHKVVPYCPRDGTALSSHEVAQGYEDVEDPSIFVRFPVVEPAAALREGDALLVWTTTPWTLVSNAAVAVDPDLAYVRTLDGFVLARRWWSGCWTRAPRSPTASTGATCLARATSRRSRSSPRPSTATRATPSSPATS